ncbi:tetratricopeptide repeat protein [bacterium]|nr:tetratricopeptide repeat protein [bacterium]
MNIMKYSLVVALIICLSAGLNEMYAGFRHDYTQAYKSYENAKNQAQLVASAERFLKLTERDDAGALKENCYYWAGECLYKLKKYHQALGSFERVMLMPGSNKEEAARFKAAMCYVKMENVKAARWELNRFLRDYPSSSLVKYVNNQLKKLPDTAGMGK